MTTVVYHSADFDGVFCREVAKRASGEDGVRYLGWNFGEAPLEFPAEGDVVVMDLPLASLLAPFISLLYPQALIKYPLLIVLVPGAVIK